MKRFLALEQGLQTMMDQVAKLGWIKIILTFRMLEKIQNAQKVLIHRNYLELKNRNIVTFVKDLVIPYNRIKNLKNPQNSLFISKR